MTRSEPRTLYNVNWIPTRSFFFSAESDVIDEERSTDAHTESSSYFGVQFSPSAFEPNNIGLLGWITPRGCARKKTEKD